MAKLNLKEIECDWKELIDPTSSPMPFEEWEATWDRIEIAFPALIAKVREQNKVLKKVQFNWEYQERTGGKYFTSAPTEQEYKKDHQKLTEKMVAEALADLEDEEKKVLIR